MGARDDLPVRPDDALDQRRVLLGRDFVDAGKAAKVVHALKDDDPLHAGGRKDVAVEAGQNVGAESVDQQMVAA